MAPPQNEFRTLAFHAWLAMAVVATLLGSCATLPPKTMNRSQLISSLESEMLKNTEWIRVHAAEGLLDHKESRGITELFRPEAETAAPPYRIGVWRVLARATSDVERNEYVARIRNILNDPQAPDRLWAAESLAKLNAVKSSDRETLLDWLKTADDATAAYPRWLLALSSEGEAHARDEAALANLLKADDVVARLRAAFALSRLKVISADSVAKLRRQFQYEPADSIARIYLLGALLLHSDDLAEIAELERSFASYAQGKSNEQLEFGIVTGRRGKPEGIPLLEPLLRSPEADARIGAAIGLLYLVQ